jgi:NAD(P)-dependent dehydrogenase (short-subunit alcohol dehydrogenase family)
LVTGASRGIGKEIALALGQAGVRVAISFRTNKLGAQKVVDELRRAGAEEVVFPTDVTDSARVGELIEAIVNRFGHLDILVNNVGVFDWKPGAVRCQLSVVRCPLQAKQHWRPKMDNGQSTTDHGRLTTDDNRFFR